MTTNYDNNELDSFEEEPSQPSSSSGGGNRNFVVAIAVLGVIFVIAIIAMVVAAVVILPANRRASEAKAAATLTQNAFIAAEATQQQATAAMLAQLRRTPSVTPTPLPSATLAPQAAPTNTAVVAQPTATAATPQATAPDSRTATVAALLTQAAEGKLTATAQGTPGGTGLTPTATALPTTGFAEDVGLPMLFGMALVLIAVIIFVRRARLSTR